MRLGQPHAVAYLDEYSIEEEDDGFIAWYTDQDGESLGHITRDARSEFPETIEIGDLNG